MPSGRHLSRQDPQPHAVPWKLIFDSQSQRGWWARLRPTAIYLMDTEVHVYALAISACVLLAFYPFLIVMLSFCHNILRWPAAEQAIYLALNDFFAPDAGGFFSRNLQPWMAGKLTFGSMFLL